MPLTKLIHYFPSPYTSYTVVEPVRQEETRFRRFEERLDFQISPYIELGSILLVSNQFALKGHQTSHT
nr:hypothetical protein Iba_chr07bCG7560 [Ipomoea batatas]GMD17629.1 hypothetical protein Iba_chr07dCG5440 [Ipomoea batatas]